MVKKLIQIYITSHFTEFANRLQQREPRRTYEEEDIHFWTTYNRILLKIVNVNFENVLV